MNRHLRVLPALAVIALLARLTGMATAQDASVTLMKTVGTVPNECAANNFLAEVPPDGKVYYCYKMTYTGAITASDHTVTDNVLGNVIHKIPGGKCCTNASGTNCAEPTDICIVGVNSCFGMYPVCVATTYPGVCCANMPGNENNCFIPHLPCEDDTNCPGQKCVINPIVGPGQMVTRVITATVPPGGVANVATWTAESGICCNDSELSCAGLNTPRFCATNEDCFGEDTCRKTGIGRCCDPNDPGSCNKVCLSGKDCAPFNDPNDPNDPNAPSPPFDRFSECVVVDTIAEDTAEARVAVFSDTPVLSAGAMALAILMLLGAGFSFLREGESRQS